MADGEPEVVEQFHGILACGTLGGRLIKDKTFFFFSFESISCATVFVGPTGMGTVATARGQGCFESTRRAGLSHNSGDPAECR